MDYNVGDIVRTKKQHPCGSKMWKLTRVGVDFKLECLFAPSKWPVILKVLRAAPLLGDNIKSLIWLAKEYTEIAIGPPTKDKTKLI